MAKKESEENRYRRVQMGTSTSPMTPADWYMSALNFWELWLSSMLEFLTSWNPASLGTMATPSRGAASSFPVWPLSYSGKGGFNGSHQTLKAAAEVSHDPFYHDPFYQESHKLPPRVSALSSRAWQEYKKGDKERSLNYVRRSRDEWMAISGPDHPASAHVHEILAMISAQVGRKANEEKNFTLAHRAADLTLWNVKADIIKLDNEIGLVFSIISEPDRLKHLVNFQERFSRLLSAIFAVSYNSDAIRMGLDLVLRHKALVMEASALQREAILRGRRPELKQDFERWLDLGKRIADKTIALPDAEGAKGEPDQRDLAALRKEWAHLEERLADEMPEMNREFVRAVHAADCKSVANALPDDSVLVEFVRFELRGPLTGRSARYLAFILPAREPDEVRMVPLGKAKPIDQAVAAFREAIGSGGRHSGPRHKVRLEEEVACGAKLRRLIFDSLLPHLGGRSRLLLAPDGDLRLVPFEVLPMADGQRLIDGYLISYVGAGRDVLHFGATSGGEPGAPLIAAGPDFDLSITSPTAPTEALSPPGRRSHRFGRGCDAQFEPLEKLKGAEKEGRQIARLLGVEPLLGPDVLEATVKKACRSPRIIHLATHGQFLPDQLDDPNADPRPAGNALAGNRPEHLKHLENPLLRSFLALAGVNTWFRGGKLPEAAEDGMLNAEDVSTLDLLDTDLAVLSACETGLGQVCPGEGVLGLQRAFMLAGAKTLVMSLWQVPDMETRELMEEFYRGVVLERKGRAEALRDAQRALKKKYGDDPSLWGAFICLGDPGPLPDRGSLAAREATTGRTQRGNSG